MRRIIKNILLEHKKLQFIMFKENQVISHLKISQDNQRFKILLTFNETGICVNLRTISIDLTIKT
jgi:hypothetical protein